METDKYASRTFMQSCPIPLKKDLVLFFLMEMQSVKTQAYEKKVGWKGKADSKVNIYILFP